MDPYLSFVIYIYNKYFRVRGNLVWLDVISNAPAPLYDFSATRSPNFII